MIGMVAWLGSSHDCNPLTQPSPRLASLAAPLTLRPPIAFTTHVASESVATSPLSAPISSSALVSVNSSYVSPGPLSLYSYQVRNGGWPRQKERNALR